MSTQNLILVYFGTTERAEALMQLADDEGSFVLHTEDTLATLGQVVVMYPHVIIVDDAQPGAVDVVMHLHSIHVGNILILSDVAHAWNTSPEARTMVLPNNSSSATIFAAAQALAMGELEVA